jgi:hypothetical protein
MENYDLTFGDEQFIPVQDKKHREVRGFLLSAFFGIFRFTDRWTAMRFNNWLL